MMTLWKLAENYTKKKYCLTFSVKICYNICITDIILIK